MEEKKQNVEKYIREQATILNSRYPEIIDDKKLQEVINYYTNNGGDYQSIITDINDRIARGIDKYLYYYLDEVENERE